MSLTAIRAPLPRAPEGWADLANLVTLVRIPLAAVPWAYPGNRTLVVVVLAIAAFSDGLDGFLARLREGKLLQEPARRIGVWLDPLCDKVFAASALSLALFVYDMPHWLAALLFTRELLLLPLGLVRRLLRPPCIRPPTPVRAAAVGRLATGAQFLTLAAFFWSHPATPFLAIATAILGMLAALHYGRRAIIFDTRGWKLRPGERRKWVSRHADHAAGGGERGPSRARRPEHFERVQERNEMVRTQLAEPLDDRQPVRDSRVLDAMRLVPRHAFMPADAREYAYDDSALRIGRGQTMSQPYIVALMTDLLRVEPDSKVLEIGTGSGYQAAVLAHLTPRVYTVEVIPELAERAERALRDLGHATVRCRAGDGSAGWPEEGPFDRILVTCACPVLPPRLWEQLKPGGVLVFPHGDPHSLQWLVVAEKTASDACLMRFVLPVTFVPMTGGPNDLQGSPAESDTRGSPGSRAGNAHA